MTAKPKGDAAAAKPDAPVRLRVEVYDALAKKRDATRVTDQARLHGISRAHMYRLRNGDQGVRLNLALRMAADLGTTVEKLFAAVEDAA